jgi:hypothetical protein
MYRLKNWKMLEGHAKYAGVNIDSNDPRDSRLRVALKLHEQRKYFEACEAMTGDSVDTRGGEFGLAIISRLGIRQENPREFYESFPEVDKGN